MESDVLVVTQTRGGTVQRTRHLMEYGFYGTKAVVIGEFVHVLGHVRIESGDEVSGFRTYRLRDQLSPLLVYEWRSAANQFVTALSSSATPSTIFVTSFYEHEDRQPARMHTVSEGESLWSITPSLNCGGSAACASEGLAGPSRVER